jgi:hypothetical protein
LQRDADDRPDPDGRDESIGDEVVELSIERGDVDEDARY